MAIPTISNNTPSAGHIAWDAFVINYEGQAFAVDAASTAERWVWWVYNAGTPSIEAGAALPIDLTDDDMVLFSNKDGLGIRIQSTSLVDGELLVDGTVLAEAIGVNQVNSTHIVTEGLDAGVVKFGEMSGDRIAAETITAEQLATVIMLVEKKIALGERISLDTTDGIKIITDDGIIQFPATGGRPSMVGDLTALSAIFMGLVDMRGDTNLISGTLSAASGITPPSIAPTLSNYWPKWKVNTSGDLWDDIYAMVDGGSAGRVYGLVQNSFWQIASLVYGATTSTLVRTLGEDGVGDFAAVSPTARSGSLCMIPNDSTGDAEYYLLVDDDMYTTGPTTYKVFKYNADFSTKLSEFTLTLPGLEEYDHPVIGYVWNAAFDAKRLGVAWPVSSTQKVSYRRYTPAGVADGAVVTSTWTTTSTLTFLHEDQTNSCLMIGVENALLAHNRTTLARVTASDYAKPPVVGSGGMFAAMGTSNVLYGAAYAFYDYGETLWHLSVDRVKKTLWSKYAFYDGDPAGVYGAGGETPPSPTKSFTKEIGAWMRIDTVKAPYQGDPDDPDRIRYYMSLTDSAYQLQATGVVGENATYLRTVISGKAPETVNPWDSRPGSSGRLRSVIGNLYGGIDTGIWDLNGSGNGRVGPLAWNTAGKDLTKTVREIGSSFRDVSSGVQAAAAETNALTVSGVPLRAGYRYRVTFTGSFIGGTAGQSILIRMKYGVAITTGGTTIEEYLQDVRVSARAAGASFVGYFDYTGVDQTVNVVATYEGSGGTAQVYCATNRLTRLIVDEISI